MHHVDLRSSYAEMGRQQGLILRGSGFNLPPPDPKMLHFARHAPELLDEMHAAADPAGVDCGDER